MKRTAILIALTASLLCPGYLSGEVFEAKGKEAIDPIKLTAESLLPGMNIIQEMHKRSHGLPQRQVQIMWERSWIRVLNDGKSGPRAVAIGLAPYEFGFHRRSIHGYAAARSDAEILAEQQRARLKRAGKAGRSRK